MNSYWVSFLCAEERMPMFEYHGPWWVSGQTFDGEYLTVVAAVRAESGEAARAILWACFDDLEPPQDVRFCNERDPDWAPFCDRFPRADWMQWPWPKEQDNA